MQIISKVKDAQVIPIQLADGSFDTVSLQGRSKIDLPEGSRLAPDREKEIRANITVVGEANTSPSAGSKTEGVATGHAFKGVVGKQTQTK